jgi:hypothetical protein
MVREGFVTLEETRSTVKIILQTLKLIAAKTSTQADDLMLAVLFSNEERLAQVVSDLQAAPAQPPSEDLVRQALLKVGIKT